MTSSAPSMIAVMENAERLWKAGQPAAAFDVYRDALAGARDDRPDGSAVDVVALERFADLAVLLHQSDAAEQALVAMAGICAAAGNWYGEDYAILKAALAAHQGGRLRDALELMYSRAPRFGDIDAIRFRGSELEAWERSVSWPETDGGDRAVMFALFYLTASRLAASLGQYRDAVEAAERGSLHARHRVPLAARYRVPLLLADALAALQGGDLRRASLRLDDVSAQADAERDPGLRFQFLEISAKLDMLRGKFGAALDSLQQAVTLADEWPESVQTACLENLAAFQILINQTAHAEQTLDRAQARVAGSDHAHLQSIARLRVMADLRARSYADDAPGSVSSHWENQDAVAVGSVSHARADESTGQPVDFLAWFEQRALGVQLALAEGRIDRARERLGSIRESFSATDSDLVRLRIDYLATLLAYYAEQYDTARALVRPLIALIERAGLIHDLWQARRLAGWIARRTHTSKPVLAAALAEEDRTLVQLADSLDSVSRAIFLLNKWTAEEEAIASLADAALVAQRRRAARFAVVRWWRALDAWRKVLAVENALEAGMRALAESAVGARVSAAPRVRLFDLWRQPADEAELTFSALPDRVIAISRSRWRARVDVFEVSRIALRQGVKEWHQRMLNAVGAAAQHSDALSASLTRLLAALPAGVRHVRVRPDDALHGYPFAAVRVDNAPAVERYTISVGHMPTRVRASTTSGVRTAVVVGADQPIGDYPGLPQAGPEVKAVGDLLSRMGFGVRVVTGDGVRKADTAAALAASAVVHIACHGRFQPDQPAHTGLILAGDGGSADTLSIADIAGIDGAGLDHVTLSACWSADNFVVPGRWIFSLPETLCRAGARSVLACLWEVDDRVGRALMHRFYANLARLSRAEALRDAQLACLRNELHPGIDTSDPVYWAGYYLFGYSGSLQCH